MALKRPRLKSDLPKQATFSATRRSSEEQADHDAETPGAAAAVSLAADGSRLRPVDRTNTSKRRLQRRVTPLEILQQPILAAGRRVFDLRRFLIVLGLTIGVMMLPTPSGMTVEVQSALALFVFTGSILALEPAPLPISALLVPVAQVALGIDTVVGAFAPFGQPSVFLILASLFLAEALRKHGLTRRMALRAIVASGGKMNMLLLSIMLLSAVLSMWVQNTATTAVLIPLAITIAQRIPGADDARSALPVLVLAVAFGASIGGLATIVGSGENAIASGVLNQLHPFGFLDWMKYGLPVMLILLPVSWWLLIKITRAPQITIDTLGVQREMKRSGPLNSTEREIIIVMLICVVLWIFGDSIEQVFGLPPTLLSSVIVSIGAVAYLSFAEIIDWNDVKGVNWGVFLVIGAGFTLGDALYKTGANDWIAGLAQPYLSEQPYLVVLVVVTVIGFAITQFINDVTLGAIFSPILVTLALASGIAPERLVIPTIIVIGLAYMFPSASARMTLVAVTGVVDRKLMTRVGLVVGLPSLVIVIGFFALLGWIGLI